MSQDGNQDNSKINDVDVADSEETTIKKPRTDVSEPISINSTTNAEPSGRPLPMFVAGASPNKYLTLDQFKEFQQMNDELKNMAIAHEISLDPNFSIEGLKEKSSTQLSKQVEEMGKKAFYDILRERLAEDPPNYTPFFSLYAELKDLALEASTAASAKIFDNFDPEEPKRQQENNCLDMVGLVHAFVDKLGKICAPIRDSQVAKLKKENDLVNLFSGVHTLLDDMKHDMLNFTVKANRHQILQHSVQMESQQFLKLLKFSPHLANETRAWLAEATAEYQSKLPPDQPMPSKITEKQLTQILAIGYARLLDGKRTGDLFPETLKYDILRVEKLWKEKFRLVICLTSVFIASNLAGKQVCEETDFKKRLKNNLLALLQDVDESKLKEALETVFLECDRQLKTSLGDKWNETFSALLKRQIIAVENESNPVRRIVEDRMFSIISTILTGPQAMKDQGSRLPPGLSLIEEELVALISQYLPVTFHNSRSFCQFYTATINEHLHHQSSPQKPSTSQ
ncbi:unnamed protein product [Bursaphelenchus xylophilus]|uniref:(pine wood nematode) hypothetical protein n=1 Tax=Bursaphelenchus xylophilus TaxID=6326 RepID=A0A1I7RK99_BURXY|nr:unnamed protein product [Bursaphelenchus xylophilus]CAG9131407.1 unnamed protein product [Bursaphelenchus xylophilus]